jgi:hypothetical protein
MGNEELGSQLKDAQAKIQKLQQDATAGEAAAADKQQELDQLGALLEEARQQAEAKDADNKRMAAELQVGGAG